MRNLITTLLLASVAISSQAQYHFHSEIEVNENSAINTLTNIPLVENTGKVDVFFNDEKPKQEYYKVRILEVSGGATYNDLLLAIQQKAKQEGFDGLLILGKSSYTYQDNSVRTAVITGTVSGALGNKNHYEPTFVSGQTLSAIGIKYKANMQFVDSIVKTAHIALKGLLPLDYTVSFLLDGTFETKHITNNTDFYLRNISLFKAADFFATVSKEIFYSAEFYYKLTGKNETDSGVIKYTATYSGANAIEEVKIKMPNVFNSPSFGILYTITYDFNDGLIAKRYIKQGRHSELVYTDVYNYDQRKRCIGFTRYNAKTKEETFTVSFDYYKIADLPEAEK